MAGAGAVAAAVRAGSARAVAHLAAGVEYVAAAAPHVAGRLAVLGVGAGVHAAAAAQSQHLYAQGQKPVPAARRARSDAPARDSRGPVPAPRAAQRTARCQRASGYRGGGAGRKCQRAPLVAAGLPGRGHQCPAGTAARRAGHHRAGPGLEHGGGAALHAHGDVGAGEQPAPRAFVHRPGAARGLQDLCL